MVRAKAVSSLGRRRGVASIYDSERLAAGYAFDRPPVHERIVRSAGLNGRARRALDIGCGAGVSTAALVPLAERIVGVEPVPAMLAHHRSVAPGARFVIGSAERLPFAAHSFDLVTAAGSLNYTHLPSALAGIARVLAPGGTFLLYDFSNGRRSVTGDSLARWFAEFERRYPWPAGWRPLDPRVLPLAEHGLRLVGYEDIDTYLPMTLDAYLRYVLSEVNVDSSVASGLSTADAARDWCRATLRPVFADGDVTVVIPGYLAVVAPGE
jgi:ubiquinone/menaquinone biosynthesis C-methylase UbiE